MMTRGVSFLASLANRVGLTTSTQGTPLLLARHHPQLLVIAQSQKGQAVPNFTEDQAREYFERLRWPDSPGCAVYRLQGESTRPGLLKCRDCKGQSTVTVDKLEVRENAFSTGGRTGWA